MRAFGGVWAGQLRWGRLTHARVLGVLNNPCYAGSYVFGRYTTRRRVDPDAGVHTGIHLLPQAQWPVVIHDHHETYITWADFEANQAKLEANCTHNKARPPREGLALCQGIILRGSRGRPMTTRYHHGGRASYECSASRADQQATPTCRSIAAQGVDEAVAPQLLTALAPDQIALALAAADEVADRHTRTHKAAELAVERARYETDRAERAFTRVEPENRLVARTLETRWEDKLTALAEAEAALKAVRKTRPPLPEPATLHTLATDLPRLWNAPDTHDRDRKRLLRALIADITVLPETDRRQTRIGIRWHTGATDQVTLTRGTPRTPPAAIELITRLGPKLTDEEPVTELATAGLHTGKERPFDIKAVRWARHAYRVQAPRTVPFQPGEIGIDEMARILKVSYSAACYWITHHRLPARQDRSGRWCVPWNQAIEADRRQRIARSGHLNPAGPGVHPVPDAARHRAITVQQAATRLGVHDYDVYYWIRTKRLHTYRTGAGRVAIPWNDNIEADCRRYAARTSQTQTTIAGGAV